MNGVDYKPLMIVCATLIVITMLICESLERRK